MTIIKWCADMAIGVPEVDAAHRRFMEDLERLSMMPDAGFAGSFLKLVADAEADFQAEERLMEDIEYGGLLEHREQHSRVLGALHRIAPRVMEGNLSLGREAVELLPQWFSLHMATMDTGLSVAIECDRRMEMAFAAEGHAR